MTDIQSSISIALLDMDKPTDPLEWLPARSLRRLGRPQGNMSERAVVLWQVDLDEIAAVNVSDAERHRARRLRKLVDKRRFLAARGFLREVLAGYLHCQPSDIPFAYGPFGKPFVPKAPVYFNASRSGRISLVALAHSPVGVDVEQVIARPDLDEIARQCLVDENAHAYADAAPSRRLECFYHAWTRSEALVKAAGLSLADARRMPAVLGGASYDTHSFSPRPGYAGAVSIRI